MKRFGKQAYFVNHPSKFSATRPNVSAQRFDAFLMFSANYDEPYGVNLPNAGYKMNLQQARFVLSDSFAAKLARGQ